MMRVLFILSLLFSSAIWATEPSSKTFDEDLHYFEIIPEQPGGSDGRLLVTELFWYGCPHCYRFEPYLQRWLATKPEDVDFVRLHVVFSPTGRLHAKTYYALELMGEAERLQTPIFSAMHDKKQRLNTKKAIEDFLVANGVDRDDFRQAFDSFAVETKTQRATLLTERYGVRGVPAIVIDGKYRTGGGVVGYNDMLSVTDFLLDQLRQTAQEPTDE